jgi:hypothetical protein
MDMQDNEFDDVFRSKLDGLEVEPSERVWGGIDDELDAQRRRKLWVPILRIAASVIIVVTAGLLFIPHGQPVKPGKPGNSRITKVTVAVITKQEATAPVVSPPVQSSQSKDAEPVNRIARVHVAPKNTEQVIVNQPQVANKQTAEPVRLMEQQAPVLAAVPELSVQNNQTAVADVPVISNKPIVADNTSETQIKPQLTAQIPVNEPAARPVKKRGIHSMGDLVNLVVARVDKRKDKAIHFSDSDDDDDNNITAVNIGPIKISKEDK